MQFHTKIEDPIFAFTVKDMRGTEITGTNTMFERMHRHRPGKTGIFMSSLTRSGLICRAENICVSFGLTGYSGGDFVVYHRLYDACSLVVVSSKNTVGFYDMNSEIAIQKEE